LRRILTTFDVGEPVIPEPGSVEPAGVNSITLLSAACFTFCCCSSGDLPSSFWRHTGGSRFPSQAPQLGSGALDALGFEFFRLFAASNDTAGLYWIAN
jgi:hypothetical protein